jgi:hypothetical protein
MLEELMELMRKVAKLRFILAGSDSPCWISVT